MSKQCQDKDCDRYQTCIITYTDTNVVYIDRYMIKTDLNLAFCAT